jgi:hypothetical protein
VHTSEANGHEGTTATCGTTASDARVDSASIRARGGCSCLISVQLLCGGGAHREAGCHLTMTEAGGTIATGVCVRSAPFGVSNRTLLRREETAVRDPYPRRSCACSGGLRRDRQRPGNVKVSPQTRARDGNAEKCATIWGCRLGLGVM